MPEIYKAFVYILAASLPAMYVAHLALKPMVGAAELRVWWTAWLCATAALLLSGNMLIYSALIAALSIYAHKTSTAPFNLFLVLLLSAPAVSENIAIPGLITSLIELSPPRIFALALLLPTAIRLWRAPSAKPLSTIDLLFGAFAGLIMVLSLRHGSPTYTLRVMALVMIDILLPYYVFSRALTSLEDIKKSLSAFIFGALPFAAVGALEMARTWRLYNSFVEHWGIVLVQPYLFRDGLLRASATAVEPIAFGFVCMVAIGCLFANRKALPSSAVFVSALGIAGLGLIAGLSRGPWLGTAALLVIVAAANRKGIRNLSTASLLAAILCLPLLASPLGDRIIRLLPFVGTVEKSNEEYRGRLIEISMEIMSRNPLFGSERYRDAPELVEMIQGQGIVDIVNTYVAIALEFGYVTLLAFLAVFAVLGYRLLLRSLSDGTDLSRALTATLVGICLTIGTVSSVSFIPYIYWVIAGLGVTLLRLPSTASAMSPTPVNPIPQLTVLGRQ